MDATIKASEPRDQIAALNAELVEALRECAASLEAVEMYEMERSGEYDALPDPALEKARNLLARVSA